MMAHQEIKAEGLQPEIIILHRGKSFCRTEQNDANLHDLLHHRGRILQLRLKFVELQFYADYHAEQCDYYQVAGVSGALWNCGEHVIPEMPRQHLHTSPA